jgi:hypothetical protein
MKEDATTARTFPMRALTHLGPSIQEGRVVGRGVARRAYPSSSLQAFPLGDGIQDDFATYSLAVRITAAKETSG